MSGLGLALDDYLKLRRGLGYKLEQEQKLLPDFVAYLEGHSSSFVTTKLSLEWATLTPTVASPDRKSKRLCMVRGFAKYLRAFDSRTEVASQELLPRCRKRVTPNLYSDNDIVELLKAAQEICTPVQAGTYSTLIGLLAVTGMRIGEAMALDRTDIDWDNKLLVVSESKFGKSRELLLHPTTIDALRAYAQIRDHAFANLRTPSFFVSLAGKRLIYNSVRTNFISLAQRAGLCEKRPRLPRLHEFRHTFAVRTLLRWYKDGLNVESRLPLLSTYLGHVSPTNTYWYLTATPELLRLAAERRNRGRGGKS